MRKQRRATATTRSINDHLRSRVGDATASPAEGPFRGLVRHGATRHWVFLAYAINARLFTRAPPPPCDPVGKEALEQRSRRRSHLACHWTRADRPLLKRGEHAGISGAPGGSVVQHDSLDLAV